MGGETIRERDGRSGRQGGDRWWIAGITAAGFAWRAIYVLVWGPTKLLFSDGQFYHYQAVTIAGGLGYIHAPKYFYLGGIHPSAAHPPAFSTLLAIVTRIGRALALGGFDSLRVHQLACAAISSAAIPIAALIARRLGGRRAMLAAAVIVAALPALWASDAVVMAESLVGVVTALSVLLTLRFLEQPTAARAAFLGAAIGLAALTRSELLLFALFLAAPALVITARRASLRTTAFQAAALALALIATLAPWTIRNLTTFDRAVFVSTNVGSMLAGANCAHTYGGRELGFWTIACNDRESKGDESVVSANFRHRGIQYALHHAGRIPIVVAARLGRTFEVFRPFDDSRDEGRTPWVEWANVLTFFPLQLGAVLGVWRLRRTRVRPSGREPQASGDGVAWPLLAVLATVVLSAAASYGITRFRVPWDVAAAVLAGVAVAGLPWRIRSQSRSAVA